MRTLILLALLGAACKPAAKAPPPRAAFEPPVGKRAFSVSLDRSQVHFLAPGDAVEIVLMVDTPRADGSSEHRAEALAARAEVLRLKEDWGDTTGLISVAMTPEEAQLAALAVEREDRLFLNKLAGEPPALAPAAAPEPPPALAPGQRGLAVLIQPDQQEFLLPGARVDVVAARRGYKAGGKAELTAVTLLQDVLVLATSPAEPEEEWASAQLMLDEEQSRRLSRAVAAEDPLTILVRSPGDRETRPVEPSKMSRKIGFAAERSGTKS